MYSKGILISVVFLLFNCFDVSGFKNNCKLREVFSWKQIGYDFDGVQYTNSTAAADSSEPFFNQYNNVPIGLEVHGDRVFVTVPRRRQGIPSTLNSVRLCPSSAPLLEPYPDSGSVSELVSVYRPRVDACGRLWVVDTGLIEIPGARRQVQPPAIIVYDLTTNKQIFRYQLKDTDLVNERTPGGLTSITVDVHPSNCGCAFAYITDLATGGIVVFSLEHLDSWRFDHPSFQYDENALNFTAAGQIINWKDGVFSVALSDYDALGKRKAYFHPLVSTKEFSIDTQLLKTKGASIDGKIKLVGDRGALSQSGSHGYHEATRTLLFANVAQDAILCWNVDTELTPNNVAIVAQDHQKLVYISDLKLVGDHVWVLSNQIPKFVFSQLNTNENNYFILKGRIQDLIRGTVCDGTKKY
ncbi:major royal jelly protein domain-containing protein [Phthorimaea operculella]|nr:major royal jelly protein domain-containing protein [Phthorimaea operculella]